MGATQILAHALKPFCAFLRPNGLEDLKTPWRRTHGESLQIARVAELHGTEGENKSALAATSAYQTPHSRKRIRAESRLASVRGSLIFRCVMPAEAAPWTEEELMRFPHDGCKCELVDDELRLSRAGMEHGLIVASLTACIGTHAAGRRFGVVCGSNLGCWMRSGNLRCPDVSYICAARVPRSPKTRQAFFRGAPDLVVEVLAPSDRPVRISEKMEDYFQSGTRLAWVINPAERNALVYGTAEADRLLRVTDTLDGEDVLPGFRLPLAELFAELSFE